MGVGKVCIDIAAVQSFFLEGVCEKEGKNVTHVYLVETLLRELAVSAKHRISESW